MSPTQELENDMSDDELQDVESENLSAQELKDIRKMMKALHDENRELKEKIGLSSSSANMGRVQQSEVRDLFATPRKSPQEKELEDWMNDEPSQSMRTPEQFFIGDARISHEEKGEKENDENGEKPMSEAVTPKDMMMFMKEMRDGLIVGLKDNGKGPDKDVQRIDPLLMKDVKISKIPIGEVGNEHWF